MGTQKSNNHGWDKPVFPSSTVDVELDNLFDQIDTDVFMRGPEADRPAAGTFGRVYVTTDTRLHFYDNGTSWDDITPSRDWSVSNSGGKVLSKPDDIDFGTALSVTDDGDGTLTIDVSGVTEAELAFDTANQAELDAHTSDTTNPHSVTASQVGAIPDTSGSVTETNLSFNPATDTELNSHTGDTSNPHSVTAAQTGAAEATDWPSHGQVNHDVIKSWNGTNEQAFGTLEPRPIQASKLPAADTAAYLSSQNEYDDNVHAKSDDSGQLTYEQAVQYAEERGGRLPTLEEVEGGVTMGSGSGYDNELIWTQTRAGPDSHYVQYGKYTNFTNDPRTTREARDDTATAVVRWVADADQSNLPATVDSNGHVYDGNGTNLADQILLAEGSGTDINQSSWVNVSWTSTTFNDAPYSFNGTTATIQESGEYEIIAEMDFSSSGASRQNPNLGLQQNGNWVGVIGRSGYMRDAEGHNHSSIHARAVVSASSGDTIHAEAYGEADTGGSITPDGAQFYIKKLHR